MFSKKPDQAQSVSRPSNSMGGNSTFSVIGSDVKITGNISATTELHIDGEIEGDIDCSSLVQGEESTITGAINAETARMAGTIIGTITARELVVLRSAHIKGDVHYDALTIEQGAEVDGRFSQRSADSASKGAKAGGAKSDAKANDPLDLQEEAPLILGE